MNPLRSVPGGAPSGNILRISRGKNSTERLGEIRPGTIFRTYGVGRASGMKKMKELCAGDVVQAKPNLVKWPLGLDLVVDC